DVLRLTAKLRGDAEGIAALCGEAGGTPADMPTQSRRAYQWLAFLGDPENLVAHLATLTEMYQTAKTGAARKSLSLDQRKLPLHIKLYATAHLYRSRVEQDGITITASEGFVGAPHSIIKALIYAALRHPEKKYAARVKAYGASDAFQEITLSLEMMTADLSTNTQGQHYDLAVVFDRVNAAYFDGALSAPRFTWNKTLTHRKFGHYQTNTDTVMLSLSLDDAAVPPYVVDFVMYHELLHKHLGVKRVNGRRYAHTAEFRDAERRFAQYEQAEAFLSKLSKMHR
ncbi:MAG: SprT-like domain-containing protein, partial [Anaerolineae bacterium]